VTAKRKSAAAARLQVVREDADVVQWRAWLRGHTPDPWRPGEWDPQTLVFSGDEDNRQTLVKRCPDCGVLMTRVSTCDYCRRRRRRAELQSEGVDVPEKATRTRKAQMTWPDRERCVIERDGDRCPRVAAIRGVCQHHYSQWHKRQRKIREGTIRQRDVVSQTLPDWIENGGPHGIPPPLDLSKCLVESCQLPTRTTRISLCSIHYSRWESERSTKSHAEWAFDAKPALGVNQFWLGQLPPLVIDELVYALAVRDSRNRKLNPSVIRMVINGIVEYGIESFATLTEAQVADMESRRFTQSYRSAVFEFARDVQEGLRSFQGVDLKSQLLWDPVEMGLSRDPSPLRGTRRRKGVDFALIEQEWLRTAAMHYCRDLTAATYLHDAHRAALYGSQVLSKRRDRGLDPSKLGQRDADRIAKRMAEESDEEGRLLNRAYRMANYNVFFKIVERGVLLGLIEGLPTTFARSKKHVFHQSETRTRESKDIRALPDGVLRTLDANLDLLAAGRRHYLMNETQVKAMFRIIYMLLRDTGRRPLEICALRTDCIGGTADEPVLRWYNYKLGRPGRDLPIEAALAREVQEWLSVRAALSIPKASRPYLFPAVTEVSAEPHFRPQYFAATLRLWANNIPFIGSGTVDDEGNEIEFDRSNIYPYCFRHTWAQRHADSGTQIEVLAELLDHEGLDTVGVYYRVSDTRKRSAIAKVAQHTFDYRGRPRPPVDAPTYQLRSLAVPYGNCTEPANVKSGGQTCPIRFQCSGCGFYRPDASHLVAIEHEIHDLRRNYEQALAIEVEPYVLQSIEGQIASYHRIVAEMKKTIDAMSEQDRNSLLEAATVMRRVRAGQRPQLKIEPIAPARTPDDSGT
jgi:integrase